MKTLYQTLCPWGCWESVERCNHLSFELFLALIDPRLRSNNHRETKLRGVHPLFPQGYTLLNKFEVRPIALITSNGSFVILTCAHHNGDQSQYVHPPLHPYLMNISPNKPERLAVTQQQLYIVKNGKPKFNSHSSHLSEERGSFSGISSSTLQFPTFLGKSTVLQDIAESLTAPTEPKCTD